MPSRPYPEGLFRSGARRNRCPACCAGRGPSSSACLRKTNPWRASVRIVSSVKSRRRCRFPKLSKIDRRRGTSQNFSRGRDMAIERHDVGPRMSKAVVNGNTVYLAGIVADNPKGKSVTEQTKDILKQIEGFLAKAGTDKSKLLSANIWITDMANFAEMNAVWDAWVAPGNTPARATVEAKLASPDYKVEIMVVAAK